MTEALATGWAATICAALAQEGIRPTCAHVARVSAGKRDSRWIEGFSPTALANQLGELAAEESDPTAMIEVVLGHDERSILNQDTVRLPRQIERGLTGLALRRGETTRRVCPSTMRSLNNSFPEAFDALARSFPVDGAAGPLDISAYATRQFVIPSIANGAAPLPVFRGKPVVPIGEVTYARVSELVRSLAGWMKRHVAGNGRLTYRYHPSEDSAAPNTNRIREFMGTIALFRAARFLDDDAMLSLAGKSLRYNLGAYYRDEDAFGIIVEGGKVKLGAAALAALAIHESDSPRRYVRQAARLTRFTERMWQDTGAFRTFLRPAHLDGTCQNFYPGETLLLWVERWIERRDADLWRKLEASFAYYRDWHRANRNPAFVPWHTQAGYRLWEVTQDEQIRDFILEMNDWLLPLQQWDEIADFPDAQGRFYDPDKPYGPPHASSTGVYLEGLIDAFRLARRIGDDSRARRYARAIRRGLRNIMQLQFSEPCECNALPNGEMARGGVRTTEYDNVIRIDNVQHNLMAAIRILETPDFLWTDDQTTALTPAPAAQNPTRTSDRRSS